MARIRTIKPEFPQSESIGKLTRDARLLYIQLWTIVDDAGRARAASRMLASLLYPYDDDAKDLIEGWMIELESGDHIRRYAVDGSHYLEIVKWLEHQKIDKPSKSRLPPFAEYSRIVAKPREASPTDLVPSTLDLVPGTKDHDGGVVETGEPKPSKSLITKDAFEITDEILKAMGKSVDDPLSVGAPYTVQHWLSQGMSRDAIMCGVTTVMAQKKNDPPSTFKYFEKAVLRASAEMNRPLPRVEVRQPETITVNANGKPRSVHDAARDLSEKLLRELDEPAPRLREPAGGGVVRLLPSR